jgi:hypothetical protein
MSLWPSFCEYIPRFFQKVMYHINPAVIKSILSLMPKEEFYRHARYIHSQMLSLPVGTNRQAMFFNLWQWCLRLHRERFGGQFSPLILKELVFNVYLCLLFNYSNGG